MVKYSHAWLFVVFTGETMLHSVIIGSISVAGAQHFRFELYTLTK